ncbi:PAS domain-containing hybrid sensor histidine kinase/response regulator [Desulfobacula sp.]
MSEKPSYEELEKRVKELEKEKEKNTRIEKEFEKRQKYLEAVFHNAPCAIVTLDSTHQVINWNPSAQKIFGYSSDEAIGKNLDDLVTRPEVEQEAHDNTLKVLSGKSLKPIESVRYRKDGTLVQVIASGAPIIIDNVLKGVVALYTDISDRKQAEVAIRQSEEKYRIVLEANPDPVVVYDIEGKIVYFNPAFTRVFGWSLEELFEGKNDAFVPEKAWRETKEMIANVLAGERFHGIETCRYNKKGEIISVSISGAVYKDQNGNPIGSIINLRDISNRKKMEAQLQQSQKMEAIGTLAGGIAHDFNNILFPIMGHAEILLMDTPEDSPAIDSLNEIYTATLRAKDLVKQILTFSRQESGELMLMKMQPIVKEALKLIRSTIPTTIEIKQEIDPGCGVIKADPTQIHQIVMNLTTNAYHAMEETGGELKVSLKEMEFGTLDLINSNMESGVYACLIVRDTGMGMDKNLIDKIFDPFFTTKGKGKGTGMGLSVVHGIVTGMGGAIHVYSEPEKGTQFHVYFPIEKSSFEGKVFNSKAQIQGGTEQILLVDDEEAILTMEKRMLERLGYHVTPRTSSIEALEAFRASPDKFDLIITDMAMPNMPGDRLSAELTKIRPDIPVLLCTGFSETMSEEKAVSLGIKGFLLKPIIMKDLAHKINEVLDK